MQKKFTLPTPTDVDYFQESKIDAALERIKSSIIQRVFSFKPDPSWNFYQMKLKLNAAIAEFGWKVETSWVGSKDDGYDTWVIKPI